RRHRHDCWYFGAEASLVVRVLWGNVGVQHRPAALAKQCPQLRHPTQRVPPDLTAAGAIFGRHRLEERLRLPPNSPVLRVDDAPRRPRPPPARLAEPRRLVASDVVLRDVVPPRRVLELHYLASSDLRPAQAPALGAGAPLHR